MTVGCIPKYSNAASLCFHRIELPFVEDEVESLLPRNWRWVDMRTSLREGTRNLQGAVSGFGAGVTGQHLLLSRCQMVAVQRGN